MRSTTWRVAEISAELSRAMPAKPSRPPTATSTPPPTIRLRLSWMSPLEVSVIVFTPSIDRTMMPGPAGPGITLTG